MNLDQERTRFEQAAMEHFAKRRQQGNVLDDNGCEITPENLFWKDGQGNYGVLMFNAAWWGWKTAFEATIERLSAGVSVELDVISEKTDEPYAYSPDAFATAVAAARVLALEALKYVGFRDTWEVKRDAAISALEKVKGP